MTTIRRPETLDDIEVMIREVAASPSTDLSYLRFLLNQYDRILTRLRVSFPGFKRKRIEHRPIQIGASQLPERSLWKELASGKPNTTPTRNTHMRSGLLLASRRGQGMAAT